MSHNFNKLKTTILGNHGERYIAEFSSNMGCIPYGPMLEQSNPVDSLQACKHKKTGKYKFASIEVKTKASMLYYPITGYDLADHKTYVEFGQPVCILFIDELKEEMYYQWVSELDKVKLEVPNRKDLIAFPLSAMKVYRKLTKEEVEELKTLSNSNYNYYICKRK
jgi:hypothetical protein